MTQATPQDPPQTVVAIGGVTVLTDGRFTAVLVLNDPQAGTVAPTAMHLVFIQDGARLLIDEVADFQRSE